MSVKIREKPNGYLYLDIYRRGHGRRWESLGIQVGKDTKTRKEAYRLAEKIRAKREFQIVSGEHGIVDPNSGRLPIVSLAEQMAAVTDRKNPIPKCIPYLREYAKGVQLGAINERWLEGYQRFLLAQESLGPSTASKYYAAVVQVLKRAVRDRLIPRNPADAVKGIRVPESHHDYLTASEIDLMVPIQVGGELGKEVKRAFLLAIMTGLRKADISSLTWGEIERETLVVHKRQKKTGRVVSIPLSDSAWALINDNALHKRDEPVFKRLFTSKTNTIPYLKKWAERAGIEKNVTWHTARRTFATLGAEATGDFYAVSKLLGHSKPTTTAVYAAATEGMRRRVVEGLPAINLPDEKATSGSDT